MAFDGLTVSNIVYELNEKIVGGRIDKVYQPERDEIIVSVRSQGNNLKLLLTANASHPRLHLTGKNRDNPMQPPMFCMVLRKHLAGGRIVSVTQPDFERIVNIQIESLNEMGDMTAKTLIIEIMGKHSNIILIDENGMILDSVKHISHSQSSVREVLPGRLYEIAPAQNKMNPLEMTQESFFQAAIENSALNVQKLIYFSYTGISPVAASEIAERAGVDDSKFAGELDEAEKEKLYNALSDLMDDVAKGVFYPGIVFDEFNKPIEFSVYQMNIYEGSAKKFFASTSEMLEFYYAEKDNVTRISQKSQDMRKLVQVNIERCVKKRDIQQKTLKDIADRDTLKLYGELITSNIYMVQKGMKSFTTINFYDEACPEITIKLDPNKTPSENAQVYFKKYNKQKRTFEALQEQIKQNDDELDYLEGVMSAVQTSVDEADIAEIREELVEQGFAKRKKQAKGTQRQKKSKPLHYKSSDGFDIYVGKNNKQNDELTLKFAMPDDIWLHTKNIPGSHVILKLQNGEASNTAIEEAANLAAFYSKGRTSSLVPVDYTPRRHVKKPGGAKPGLVIYETNKTAYVTPDELMVNTMEVCE